MRHGVLRRRSKRRPAKKVRFGKRTMKWGGAGSQDASAAGGGGGGAAGGGAEGQVVENATPYDIVDGFRIPPAEGGVASGPPPMGTPPEASPEAVDEAVVLPVAPGIPIGYRIWNVIFHSTILYIEAMAAQGLKIRVQQLCAFVWNMLGMIHVMHRGTSTPLTYFISETTTALTVQLVAGANFATELFSDFVGGGMTYLYGRAVEAGGIALGLLQPVLMPLGVLINLAGRAAVNVAPLAPPVALIAWMGVSESALADVNWLIDTMSNAATATNANTRRIITERYGDAITRMTTARNFLSDSAQIDAYAGQIAAGIPGGTSALFYVRRAVNFQANIVRNAGAGAAASAPAATAVFVYTVNTTVRTYGVLNYLLEELWGVSFTILQTGMYWGYKVVYKVAQGVACVGREIGRGVDVLKQYLLYTIAIATNPARRDGASISSGGSSISSISSRGSQRIAGLITNGKVDDALGQEAQQFLGKLQAEVDDKEESLSPAAGGGAAGGGAAGGGGGGAETVEAAADVAAVDAELMAFVSAAADLASRSNQTVEFVLSAKASEEGAAGGGGRMGSVLQAQMQRMEDAVGKITGGAAEAAPIESVIVEDQNPEANIVALAQGAGVTLEGNQVRPVASATLTRLDSSSQEAFIDDEVMSPPTNHQKTFFKRGTKRGASRDEEEEEETHDMLGAMGMTRNVEQRREEEEEVMGGEGEDAAEEEEEEEKDMGGMGGRRTRHRRRNAAKAKRGKRKTIKKRKARRVNKKR